MKTNESTENYLETILFLSERNPNVRSIDVAHELSFSKPSVSVAMKLLREKEYITMDESGNIFLTETGKAIAKNVSDRHNVIAEALMLLGVDEKTAYNDSCKIEHFLSESSFEKIKRHLNEHKSTKSRHNDIDVVLL